MVRKGLRRLLARHAHLTVCGDSASGPKAFSAILELQPELLIVDLRLKSGNGFEFIRQLRRALPTLKILVFSMHEERWLAGAVRAAGAQGCVSKVHGTERLLEAIEWIANRPAPAAVGQHLHAPTVPPAQPTAHGAQPGEFLP